MQGSPIKQEKRTYANKTTACRPMHNRFDDRAHVLRGGQKHGFTLVEIIVTLVILSILAAILIPAMVNWIDKANEKSIIVGCRTCVNAAQTLSSEQYGTLGAGNINVTPDEVLALAKVPGQVSGIEIDQSNAVLLHLTYKEKDKTVTYCRFYDTCSHEETYNFDTGGGSGGNNDANGFYVGDTGIHVNTNGDLATFDPGPGGFQFTGDALYYYEGNYYHIRDRWLGRQTDLAAFVRANGVLVNTSKFATSSEGLAAGDLKVKDGKVYVFRPYDNGPWGDVAYNNAGLWVELRADMP